MSLALMEEKLASGAGCSRLESSADQRAAAQLGTVKPEEVVMSDFSHSGALLEMQSHPPRPDSPHCSVASGR